MKRRIVNADKASIYFQTNHSKGILGKGFNTDRGWWYQFK